MVAIATKKSNKEIYEEAITAGKEAVAKLTVRPMVVTEVGLDDKPYPGSQSWFVADGVCGFAWINIRPATKAGRKDCGFVQWLRAHNIGSYDDYTKAWSIWIGDYNQCMQKKEAHANAMADFLCKYGIRAVAGSRLD